MCLWLSMKSPMASTILKGSPIHKDPHCKHWMWALIPYAVWAREATKLGQENGCKCPGHFEDHLTGIYLH